MRYTDRRNRELESEINSLRLSCTEVALAMSRGREQLPELRDPYMRLTERSIAAVCEWHRLSDPQAALH